MRFTSLKKNICITEDTTLKLSHSTSPWYIQTTAEILNTRSSSNIFTVFLQLTMVLSGRRHLKSLVWGKPQQTRPTPPHKSCYCSVVHHQGRPHLSPQSKPGKNMFRKYWSCYLSKRLREGFAYLQ